MSDPEIRIEENGPYEVKGPLPISRTRTVKTEFGEPVDYAPFEPLEAGETYRLCRCGKSGNKPFCDDSHLEEPRVDVTERADHGPRDDRTDVFQGPGRGDHQRRPLDLHEGGLLQGPVHRRVADAR